MMDIIKAKMARASVFAFAAAAAGAAMAGLGPGDYVQNGLVAIYDGFYNAKDAAGVPIHDANATTWANLANGCGDFALPQGSFTLGASNVTLNTTATAPDCSVARATGNITLEACVKSETASATGSTKNFLEIANRAGMGYDARSGYHFTVYVLDSSAYGSAKKKYYKCSGTDFADYAPFVHSVSWVSANAVQGTIRADGESGGTLSHFYTATSVSDPPDGGLVIGKADINYAYFCIRIYNRGLTDDERNLNAAIDAVRFQGKSCGEVTLPDGYSFDENGNPATAFEAAYLLNCAVDEVEEKKADFKFESIVPGEVPSIEGDFNGVVHIFGAATLEGDIIWSENEGAKASARFFKAELKFR